MCKLSPEPEQFFFHKQLNQNFVWCLNQVEKQFVPVVCEMVLLSGLCENLLALGSH